MTLANLKTYLTGAISGVDITMVLFDFLVYANKKRSKTYPLAVWDLGNLKGLKNLRATTGQSGVIEIDLYCMDLVTPEDDIPAGSIAKWDALEADMLAYLNVINALDYLRVANMDDIDYEYYPGGMLTMEREVGVRYKIELEIWC